MKKLLMMMMSLAMVMMLAGCGGDSQKKLVIGLDDNFAPMGFRNDKNEIVGFDIDLAREACKRLNMEVEFKPIDWGAKEAEMKSKRIDAIWNCFTVNEEREKTYGLSEPYIVNSQLLVVPAGSDIKTKAERADKAAAYMDLDNKRVDVMIVDAVLARYYDQKNPGKYTILDENMGDEVVAVAFRKDDNELREKFNKALAEMKKDGTCKKISEKWMGADITKY